MAVNQHFETLVKYYEGSRPLYDIFGGGAKHLGFRPKNSRSSESTALTLMHDFVAQQLSLSESVVALDAGCGEGIVSSYLSMRYECRIEAITVVPFEARRAVRLAREQGSSDLARYYLMDYSELAYADSYFDAVYTVESLVHSPNVQRTLSEFYRVLKPRGRIALFEYSLADDPAFTEYEIDMINKVAQSSAMAALKGFRNDRVEQLLETIGFRAIDTLDITDNVAPSVHRLRRYFIVPYLFVKLLRLQTYFPNLTGVVEFSKLGEKGLMKYKVISAIK